MANETLTSRSNGLRLISQAVPVGLVRGRVLQGVVSPSVLRRISDAALSRPGTEMLLLGGRAMWGGRAAERRHASNTSTIATIAPITAAASILTAHPLVRASW